MKKIGYIIIFIIVLTLNFLPYNYLYSYLPLQSREINTIRIILDFVTGFLFIVFLQSYKHSKRDNFKENSYRRDNFGYIYDSEIDSDLSKYYSEKYNNITKGYISVYKFNNLNNHIIRKPSPVFSTTKKEFRIFINERFWQILENREKDGVILHEIGHYIKNDEKNTYLMSIIFLLTSLGLILALVNYVLTRTFILSFIIILTLVAVMVLDFIILKVYLIQNEIRADRFALNNGVTMDIIKSTLQKALSFASKNIPIYTQKRLKKELAKRFKQLGRL